MKKTFIFFLLLLSSFPGQLLAQSSEVDTQLKEEVDTQLKEIEQEMRALCEEIIHEDAILHETINEGGSFYAITIGDYANKMEMTFMNDHNLNGEMSYADIKSVSFHATQSEGCTSFHHHNIHPEAQTPYETFCTNAELAIQLELENPVQFIDEFKRAPASDRFLFDTIQLPLNVTPEFQERAEKLQELEEAAFLIRLLYD